MLKYLTCSPLILKKNYYAEGKKNTSLQSHKKSSVKLTCCK